MGTQLRTCLLLIGPLLGTAALSLHERGASVLSFASSVEAQERKYVDQPAHWVAFSAVLRRIHERDGAVFVGRQYRNADGSTRNETGRSFDRIDSVAIQNIPEATFYRWIPETGWTSQPMLLPQHGLDKPLPIILNDGMAQVNDTVEGFTLIRTESAGRALFRAPLLNMFTLVTIVKCKFDATAKCGTWYSNIKLEEPPSELFSPPSGVDIVKLEKPGGIIARQS